MPVVRIKAKDFAKDLKRRTLATNRAVADGMRLGAERAKGILIRRTPTDTGRMRNSWKVRSTGARRGGLREYELINDAPYAGVIEHGARPHSVNREGVAAITAWARRKFPSANEQQLRGIVWGIVNNLKRKGQRPTFFVRDSRKDIASAVKSEVDRRISALTGKRFT